MLFLFYILKQACQKFEDDFRTEYGFDTFEKHHHHLLLLLVRLFLTPNTIAFEFLCTVGPSALTKSV